jgi:hypothetical protein
MSSQRTHEKNRLAGAVALLLFFTITSGIAQEYSIDWFTIDGGGGTSTGSGYELTGTIGQPDAGAMSGGDLTLTGGFWGMLAASQTPVGPRLTLAISATSTNTLVVSWLANSDTWQLQQNTDLATSGWSNVITAPVVIAGKNQVVLPRSPGKEFYRLQK